MHLICTESRNDVTFLYIVWRYLAVIQFQKDIFNKVSRSIKIVIAGT